MNGHNDAIETRPQTRRSLQLLPTPPRTPRLQRAAREVQLAAAPYRPGELPEPLTLTLNEKLVSELNTQAARRRVPVELLVRVSVEAARALEHVPYREVVGNVLDCNASDALPLIGGEGAQGLLARYAARVRRGERESVTRITKSGEVQVSVTLAMAAAWRREANVGRKGLSNWAAEMLVIAPARAIEWEAAAAAQGQSVTEWVYTCALRLASSASAAPQART